MVAKRSRFSSRPSWDELADDQRLESAHRMAVYAAQVDSIDQNLGRLVQVLKQQNEWDNTIIFFLSDNGCSAEGDSLGFRRDEHDTPVGGPESYASAGLEWANVCNTPLRKFKMFAHEGGIASPLIVHWPNGLNGSNRLIHSPAHVIDLMPTCLELAGAAYPQLRNNVQVTPLPGKSLLPWLQDKNADNVRSTPLFWEHQGNRAIRHGDWKLVSQHRGNWELYNLKSDRTETQDLSQEFPDRVIELSKQWQAWADLAGVAKWPIK
ncbi:MAG: sulfatase-like hydrolase/transferase [Pirellulaceae bacterium]